ncbi:unnamed protein product [Caenorhabditis auriculariae]|uniref:C2H2-type domain-containing protein n=1 Tax=Caenorhabditis auriculariae TaxID=2777116 RepID=A0A8S1HP57_9PELO|nr:unnamed protein product [Caenorhabditis auriculariae]
MQQQPPMDLVQLQKFWSQALGQAPAAPIPTSVASAPATPNIPPFMTHPMMLGMNPALMAQLTQARYQQYYLQLQFMAALQSQNAAAPTTSANTAGPSSGSPALPLLSPMLPTPVMPTAVPSPIFPPPALTPIQPPPKPPKTEKFMAPETKKRRVMAASNVAEETAIRKILNRPTALVMPKLTPMEPVKPANPKNPGTPVNQVNQANQVIPVIPVNQVKNEEPLKGVTVEIPEKGQAHITLPKNGIMTAWIAMLNNTAGDGKTSVTISPTTPLTSTPPKVVITTTPMTTSPSTSSNLPVEEEDEQFIDVESVDDDALEGRDRRKAHVEFYRKVKSIRMRAAKETSVKCAKCDEMVENNDNALQRHLTEHCDAGGYHCKLCGWQSPEKYRMYEHMRKEHPKKVDMFSDKRNMTKLSAAITECFPRLSARAKKEAEKGSDRFMTELMKLGISYCALCRSDLRMDKYSILRHVQTLHTVKCKHCKTTTNTSEGQIRHQLEAHGLNEPQLSVDYAPCSADSVLLPQLQLCFPTVIFNPDSEPGSPN